jgi:hypothetical protein
LAVASREKRSRPKKNNVQRMFNTHDPLEEIHRAGQAQEDDYFRKLDQALLGRSAPRVPQRASRPCGTLPVCAAHSVASLSRTHLPRGPRWRRVPGVAGYGGTKGRGKGVWGRKHTAGSNGFSLHSWHPTVNRKVRLQKTCFCRRAAQYGNARTARKRTHEQTFLGHAASPKRHARAS